MNFLYFPAEKLWNTSSVSEISEILNSTLRIWFFVLDLYLDLYLIDTMKYIVNEKYWYFVVFFIISSFKIFIQKRSLQEKREEIILPK